MNSYRIALLPGDGIGREVIPAAVRVLEAGKVECTFSFQEFDWGSEYYLRTGRMMPEDGLDQLRPFDAILLGAIGHPKVPDHISLRELLLRIRFGFDLYVNLRPVEVLPGLEPPLRGKKDIRMLFVRENTEGEYCGLGGRFKRGTEDEVAMQQSVFTRKGVERVVRYAFEQARRRPRKRLASATKSNAMAYTAVLWDEVVREVARDYPDVVVASNLFADILTDLGGALQGSLGLAPSANLNPTERKGPPMFEPVHGSAPAIAAPFMVRACGYPLVVRVNSTLRFFCRPSGSSDPSGFLFGATGLVSPQPCVVILDAFTPPFSTNHFFTASARLLESVTL